MNNKNPYYMKRLKERREELCKRLKAEPDKEKWDQVKALFAVDFGLREEKVEEYAKTLIKAGLIGSSDD